MQLAEIPWNRTVDFETLRAKHIARSWSDHFVLNQGSNGFEPYLLRQASKIKQDVKGNVIEWAEDPAHEQD